MGTANGQQTTPIWKQGFGVVSSINVVPHSTEWSLIGNVLFVNTPQLILSFAYLCFNTIFTVMVSAHEFTKFASVRKALRVSKPRGQQRTTFWLQLPYRYIVPVLTTMAVLHWAVSRSIFLVDLKAYNVVGSGLEAKQGTFSSSGYSPMAITVSVGIGTVMATSIIALSRCRLNAGIPSVGSNSLAISAASYLAPSEREDAVLLPLMYGFIHTAERDENGKRRVGFSCERVCPLVDDEMYS